MIFFMPRIYPPAGVKLSAARQRFVKKLSGRGANHFAIATPPRHDGRVTQPLALVYYEKLMPGSQLVNRLRDLNYLVKVVNDPALLLQTACDEGPLVILADLAAGEEVCRVIATLKSNAATSHIPVIAFATEETAEMMEKALKSGAKLVVSETVIAGHLPELLNQALQIE
jgi:PleD family two-component response regulator